MATICKRKKGDVETWRVIFRKSKGNAYFCLTFSERDDAVEWCIKNEKLFYEDPNKYFSWRLAFFEKMRRKNLEELDGILYPTNHKLVFSCD